MIYFVRFYFMYPNVRHPNPRGTDKSWNINQSQYPHIWRCENLTDLGQEIKLKLKFRIIYRRLYRSALRAYRGTHVGAFNLEFWSQINEVFSSEETLWLLNLGRKPLTTMTRVGFEPTLLPSRRFTVINRKPYLMAQPSGGFQRCPK